MKPLLHKATLEALKYRLEASTRLLVFIDYESVLVAPSAAGAPTPLENDDREHLRELSERNNITLVIVSNRALASIKKLVGFTGIYFIANNGMEISGPDLNVVHGEAKRVAHELGSVAKKITGQLSALPGILLENREYSIAVNIANAKPPIQRRTRLLMEQIWTPVMDSFTLYEARHELILRPRVGWSKSRAIMFIWNKFSSPHRRPFVAYISSEDTDEEIFAQLGREGMGVMVGNSAKADRSKAGYQLKNRLEVNRFIAWLSQNISKLRSPNSSGS